MSEFHVQVVRVCDVQPHPNADTLSIATVAGGYPVIFRTGDYKEGDLAVHVPIDAVVPAADPRWAFLGDHTRITAKRLRGTFSMGILTPAEPGWIEGQNVQEELGILKREEELHTGGGLAEPDPGFIPVYTDIEGLRRWPDAIVEGEEVIIREKIHGENARLCWARDRLWVGSRTMIKADRPDSQWWRAARAEGLDEKLKSLPDVVLYGECHGYTGGFAYGVKPGTPAFRAFDALDVKTRTFWDHARFADTMDDMQIHMAPRLYRGPWSNDLRRLAEGPSTLDERHVREGFVVKPTVERRDPRFGRVILKLIGEGFHLKQAKAK